MSKLNDYIDENLEQYEEYSTMLNDDYRNRYLETMMQSLFGDQNEDE